MTLRIGIIGGGLMGREAAACFGRWFALENFPVRAELVAVCDLRQELLDWFAQVPTVQLYLRFRILCASLCSMSHPSIHLRPTLTCSG